jgi:hypothetical protein
LLDVGRFREETMAFGRWARGVALAAIVAAGPAQAGDLALKRVLLSTGGVGLYEYEAEVEGDATVEWKAPLDEIDDILKSLVVFDDRGGVGGLDLPGPQPLAETFRNLPFTAQDLRSTPELLTALRGAEIEVGGARALHGRIVSVTQEREATPDGKALTTRHRVALMTDAGLESFVLEQAESLRFADPSLRAALETALHAVAADSQKGSRALRIVSKGQGKRKLHVAYLAAAPIWKVSYRLVLGADPDKARLQGWATLENVSGQDWRNVDLTLVSGRPVSYRQALYRAYQVERPEAPLDLGPPLNPAEDRGAMPAPAAAQAENRTAGKMSAPPLRSARETLLSPGAAAVAAQEGETEVAFHLGQPASVANGRTLSLPILDALEPVARIALYDPNVDRRHPLSAAELTNGAKSALPPGIVTIYDETPGGVVYLGDSRLSATPAGEKRPLSFALDQKTTVAEDDSDKTELAEAHVAKGVLTLENVTRRRTVYHVKADEPRRLVVLTPELPGGKLTEPSPKGVTQAEGRWRVPFDVKAGEGQTFAVAQERRQTRLVALAGLDDASLAVYAKSRAVDAATRASLQKLAGLRGTQAEAERALGAVKTQIEAVIADQTRLKDLLGAVAAGSDLAKRYLGELDADETKLAALRATAAERETARDAARKAVEAFVAGM